MIRLLNYQRHASQGLLRDPSLLRGINMMPSTSRHFLESRHLIICWTRCTIKAPPPPTNKNNATWNQNLGGDESPSMTLNFVPLSNHPFTPFWNPTTFDYCKWVEIWLAKSWKFHPQINRLRTTNHSLRNTEKIHLPTPKNQWMEYLYIHLNPVNYQNVRWVSGRQTMVWFLLKKNLPSWWTWSTIEILHLGCNRAL